MCGIVTGHARVLLDLRHVTYLDSSGMGALVAAMKHARGGGGDLHLCALRDDVRAIFEMTRLVKALTVHPTRQEALGSWK